MPLFFWFNLSKLVQLPTRHMQGDPYFFMSWKQVDIVVGILISELFNPLSFIIALAGKMVVIGGMRLWKFICIYQQNRFSKNFLRMHTCTEKITDLNLLKEDVIVA